MQYRLVKIQAEWKGPKQRKWKVSFSDIVGDRKVSKAGPNPLGFYYYPTSISDQVAFAGLRDRMVAEHFKNIDNLIYSAKELGKLRIGQ